MRIDGPKGLGAWLHGWFSGSFKGNLEGTASFAETASYVRQDGVDGLESTLDEYLHKEQGGVVGGELVLSGSVGYSSRLKVHGNITVLGSITEGINTEAAGDGSHAEGSGSKALGAGSHAEGKNTRALGVGSHAEGRGTSAIGIGSHAEGRGTLAYGDYQHVEGKFNIPDKVEKYATIVGNGTSDDNRSNAFAVRWDGDVEVGKRLIIENNVVLEYNKKEKVLDFKIL